MVEILSISICNLPYYICICLVLIAITLVVHDFFGLLLTKHFEIEYVVLSPGSLKVDRIFLFKFDRRRNSDSGLFIQSIIK